MNEPIPPMVPPDLKPLPAKYNLRCTAVKFDETTMMFTLIDDGEVVTRLSLEFLVDLLSMAPESFQPHILKSLAEAQLAHQQMVERLMKEHPERVVLSSMLIPEGANYRRVFYRGIQRDKLPVSGWPQRVAFKSHEGKLYRIVRELTEGEPMPIPDRVMIHPETWTCYLLEEVPEPSAAS